MKINNKLTIGIDLGGTKMSAVLFDGEKVLDENLLATPKNNLENIIIMMAVLIEPLIKRAAEFKRNIKGVGIGAAGVMDIERKKILNSPNLKILNNVKLAEKLEEKIKLKTKLENDAKCFIMAECKLGAGKKYKNIYGLTIGTGIGGGWFINNEIYKGSHGGAGEVGHMIMDSKDLNDLEDLFHNIMKRDPIKIAQRAYSLDRSALRIYEEFSKILGLALANIANIIDPEVFIIGGGVINSADLFLPRAEEIMKKNIQSSEISIKIKILKSKLDKNAGAIGAAMIV